MEILISTPKLSALGGVSTYWNSILPILYSYDDIKIKTMEIGGHGKNIVGPVLDQWNFHKKANTTIDLAFLNPSLGSKSFFRDALFARQLIKKNIPFIVFFHGWNLDFEKKVENNYIAFFLNTFGQAKKIFVLSKDFKNKILEWGYKGEVIIETTNIDAVLLKNFSIREKFDKTKTIKKIRILFLARLIREKGIFEIVEAFNILVQKYDNIELIIAGDGRDYEELKSRVKGNEKITVVGYVEGDEKIKLFTESHIYCLPSYSEGLPTSVLEAMAFGLPVITTRVGGLKSFFHDGEMGYFVKTKESGQLVEKLELLLTDRDIMLKMGEFNHKYAKEKLLNTIVAERIYKQVKLAVKNTGKADG